MFLTSCACYSLQSAPKKGKVQLCSDKQCQSLQNFADRDLNKGLVLLLMLRLHNSEIPLLLYLYIPESARPNRMQMQ